MKRFDPAEFPEWLHDDVALANRALSDDAYKASRMELDFGLVNAWFDALERLLVYRAATRRPGEFVTVGRYRMQVAEPDWARPDGVIQ